MVAIFGAVFDLPNLDKPPPTSMVCLMVCLSLSLIFMMLNILLKILMFVCLSRPARKKRLISGFGNNMMYDLPRATDIEL